jgi:hypothetical protein
MFEHMRAIAAYLVFPNRQTLMKAPVNPKPPPEIEARSGL